jgi:glutamate dehydrogenase
VVDIDFLVQAIIDLLIPVPSSGIKESVVDLYGKPELLFLGPDGKALFTMTRRRE